MMSFMRQLESKFDAEELGGEKWLEIKKEFVKSAKEDKNVINGFRERIEILEAEKLNMLEEKIIQLPIKVQKYSQ
jgi:hypothetical protein